VQYNIIYDKLFNLNMIVSKLWSHQWLKWVGTRGNAVPTPPLKIESVPTHEQNLGTLCNAVPTPPLKKRFRFHT